jgi:hypothetical protein
MYVIIFMWLKIRQAFVKLLEMVNFLGGGFDPIGCPSRNKSPKVKKIAQSGHLAAQRPLTTWILEWSDNYSFSVNA